MHDWELQRLRTAYQSVMPDTCDIYRRNGDRDEYGGGADYGDDPIAEGVPLLVEPLAVSAFAESVGGAGREVDTTSFELAFPHGTDVNQGDLVVVTSLNDAHFTVRQVEAPESWDAFVSAQGVVAR